MPGRHQWFMVGICAAGLTAFTCLVSTIVVVGTYAPSSKASSPKDPIKKPYIPLPGPPGEFNQLSTVRNGPSSNSQRTPAVNRLLNSPGPLERFPNLANGTLPSAQNAKPVRNDSNNAPAMHPSQDALAVEPSSRTSLTPHRSQSNIVTADSSPAETMLTSAHHVDMAGKPMQTLPGTQISLPANTSPVRTSMEPRMTSRKSILRNPATPITINPIAETVPAESVSIPTHSTAESEVSPVPATGNSTHASTAATGEAPTLLTVPRRITRPRRTRQAPTVEAISVSEPAEPVAVEPTPIPITIEIAPAAETFVVSPTIEPIVAVEHHATETLAIEPITLVYPDDEAPEPATEAMPPISLMPLETAVHPDPGANESDGPTFTINYPVDPASSHTQSVEPYDVNVESSSTESAAIITSTIPPLEHVAAEASPEDSNATVVIEPASSSSTGDEEAVTPETLNTGAPPQLSSTPSSELPISLSPPSSSTAAENVAALPTATHPPETLPQSFAFSTGATSAGGIMSYLSGAASRVGSRLSRVPSILGSLSFFNF
jgi:hypothetical protein